MRRRNRTDVCTLLQRIGCLSESFPPSWIAALVLALAIMTIFGVLLWLVYALGVLYPALMLSMHWRRIPALTLFAPAGLTLAVPFAGWLVALHVANTVNRRTS